jgi:nitroreductase
VEFQDVVRRRRMVRNYDLDRPVPPEVVERILENALRAPSAGFSQGFGFLVVYREQFGVPDNFLPIGAVSIGYSDEPPRDLSKRRKPASDLIHRSRWTS